MVYLTNNVSAKCAEISALIGVSVPRTRAILSEMVEDNIIVAEGENKNRIYKFKFQRIKVRIIGHMSLYNLTSEVLKEEI